MLPGLGRLRLFQIGACDQVIIDRCEHSADRNTDQYHALPHRGAAAYTRKQHHHGGGEEAADKCTHADTYAGIVEGTDQNNGERAGCRTDREADDVR